MSSAVGVVAVKVANDSGQKVLCTGKEISKVKISCLVEGTMHNEPIWTIPVK